MTHPVDRRELHLRREKALWKTKVAGFAAFGSATLAVCVFAAIAFDTHDLAAVAPYFLGAALTFGFGAGVYYRQSQLAAWVLLGLAVTTMAVRIVQTGQFSAGIVGVALVYCYFRGVTGAIDLAELDKDKPAELRDPAI
jgi:hypothetical protein